MALNPYAPCPCGSGKKLKFCCSDLMSEMEKIQRMLDGDQRAACLTHVRSLTAKHPDHASLLGLQARLEIDQEQLDEAGRTISTFLEKHPGNRIALAESAILKAATEGGRAAVEPLQQALSTISNQMPLRLYEAIGAVARALLAQGDVFAARAHLLMQGNLEDTADGQARAMLMRLYSLPQIPLLLKDDWRLAACPADVPWRAQFEEAMVDANRGAWQRAERRFASLVEPSADSPAVWRNLAILRGWIADAPGMLAALRKYASLDLPLDDAMEAEALAQLIDPAVAADRTDVVRLTYPVADVDKLTAALASDSRASQLPISPHELKHEYGEDQPPPRSIHLLLDRPLPGSGADLTLADVPHVTAQVHLFGRQTDREARLELVAIGPEKLQSSKQTIGEIGADALGEPGQQEVVSQVPAAEEAIGWSWRLPIDTPIERREALVDEQRRRVLLERWTAQPLAALEGKTPTEAAGDPALRIRVLAAILLLELATEADDDRFDFNELRGRLGLPTAEGVDPSNIASAGLSLARLQRVMAEKLSDKDLLIHYRRAAVMGVNDAIRNLAVEVVRRESLDDKVDKAEAYGLLASLEANPVQALEYIDKARTISEAAGESSAPWDLAELELQIQVGNPEAAQNMLTHVRSAHLREPGVAARLFEILVAAGILNPDGTPAGPLPEARSNIVLPSGQTKPSAELWTPEGSAASPGEKPKIWTPGMS